MYSSADFEEIGSKFYGHRGFDYRLIEKFPYLRYYAHGRFL